MIEVLFLAQLQVIFDESGHQINQMKQQTVSLTQTLKSYLPVKYRGPILHVTSPALAPMI